MVIGTNALITYALEANAFNRDAADATLDFDMALTAIATDDTRRTLWMVLKEVDMTYAVNAERPFQARNAKAYEVEIPSVPRHAASSSHATSRVGAHARAGMAAERSPYQPCSWRPRWRGSAHGGTGSTLVRASQTVDGRKA
jgi:hypothetical protein